jgi:hypothetical protein
VSDLLLLLTGMLLFMFILFLFFIFGGEPDVWDLAQQSLKNSLGECE